MFIGMWFRRLYDFNMALVAKQGWRLLTVPHFLFAKIYQARYYPELRFLDAVLGSSPSFVWNDIMKVLPLIRHGLIKTIGDGTDVGVFKDPWLLG